MKRLTLFVSLCAGLVVLTPMGDRLIARQTPTPRPIVNPAIKTRAESDIARIRSNASRYDQAVAAIGRLASAPVSTNAQVAAAVTAVRTNVTTIGQTVRDRLMHIGLSDASFKQSIQSSIQQKDARTLANDFKAGGVDRIGGASSVRGAISRRLQEDAQTLRRSGEALLAKSKGGRSPLASLGEMLSRVAAEVVVPVSAQGIQGQIDKAESDFVLQGIVLLLFAILEGPVESIGQPQPPGPTPREACQTAADKKYGRCIDDAGSSAFASLACAAQYAVESGLCLLK